MSAPEHLGEHRGLHNSITTHLLCNFTLDLPMVVQLPHISSKKPVKLSIDEITVVHPIVR